MKRKCERCMNYQDCYYCVHYEEDGYNCKNCAENNYNNFKHKPLVKMTNREWLENLSDEQWAKVIPCFGLDNPFANCPKNMDCIKCKIDWLNAEHKE